MSTIYSSDEVGRLPLPNDNVAIATRLLEAGTKIRYGNDIFTLNHTVMEGHRFAIKRIEPGEHLLSWELPFGIATELIEPGHYVINETVLEALSARSLHFSLPNKPNFTEHTEPFQVDETTFQPADTLPPYKDTRTFLGYRRSEKRGVGTRNYIVLLGTSSRTASYVRQLAARLNNDWERFPNIDGIVPVAHTEGGTGKPNNLSLLLRTLAGFIVNPNVGAVLIVDQGSEFVNNEYLKSYMLEQNYPLDDVLHQFYTMTGDFQRNLDAGEQIVRDWLPKVNETSRTPESIAHLKIALQCGGSDAFSGISANPLLGWISQELIRYGGAANLAETDELIGAEPYVLQKVRDLETAKKFLATLDRFKERASWHGANAEGNPSGGNKYRGLYNITLKSIGAARKKDPETRLDYVIEYGEPMKNSGYHFMDSPGNDLESIAGQVASGCNLIFFTTGNGSITNFPFVPTIKVVTTSRRFELLSKDMDVNAGVYLEGTSMDELGNDTFDLMIDVASGKRSVGELAGHSQVQIWRNWQQTDASQLDQLLQLPKPSGKPIPVRELSGPATDFRLVMRTADLEKRKIGLILPTSLCSGQVGNLISMKLNDKKMGQPDQLSRFVTLVHTEGCGNSTGPSEELYARTMVGYATHPLVKHCLMLEHGCEKTHNEFMRHQLKKMNVDPESLGYASIQLDGGIESVTNKVESWFAERLKADQINSSKDEETVQLGLESLTIGVMTDGKVSDAECDLLAELTKQIVHAGGTVVIPENSELTANPEYASRVLVDPDSKPSLAYGEHVQNAGFHIMETQTKHWVETMTGLAATGVEIIIALANEHPMQVHPFVPVLQMTSNWRLQQTSANDMDILLAGDPNEWLEQVFERIKQVIAQTYVPQLFDRGNIDFQLTRGYLGVSL